MNPETCPMLSSETASVILSATKLIGKSSATPAAIGGLLELLSDRPSLERGRVILPDPVTGVLRISYAHELTERQKQRGTYAPGEGVTGRVMSTAKIALIRDIRKDAEYLSRVTTPAPNAAEPVAYIAVPIIHQDLPVGVLAVHRATKHQDGFETDLYILQIFAAMIGQLLLLDQQMLRRAQEADTVARPSPAAKIHEPASVHGIIGNSKALRHAVTEAQKAAGSDATVMLVGESGCGKERFARMIHLASERRDQPFVCINCAAIPANLLETELFGHEKGAFTGAIAVRAGKFEIATGGTLFLDEIGDMPLDLQAKLLRVLQERSVQRIGSNNETPVDVRILTATNKPPEEAVKRGDFRLDLFYRLNVIRILLPPLRDRNGDIELLALYFLARYNQQYRRDLVLEKSALNCLATYDWPGNVRQLENIIERLVIMSENDRIGAAEISAVLTTEAAIDIDDIAGHSAPGTDTARTFSTGTDARPYQKVSHADKGHIMAALRLAKGNKTHAARALGMSARQLQYRLAKLNIAS